MQAWYKNKQQSQTLIEAAWTSYGISVDQNVKRSASKG